jgi:hypothetical protein
MQILVPLDSTDRINEQHEEVGALCVSLGRYHTPLEKAKNCVEEVLQFRRRKN